MRERLEKWEGIKGWGGDGRGEGRKGIVDQLVVRLGGMPMIARWWTGLEAKEQRGYERPECWMELVMGLSERVEMKS